MLGFPGGPGVKSLPCNVKDTGLIPGQGRSHMSRTTMIPYAQGSCAHPPQLLSPAPQLLKLVLHNRRRQRSEKPAHHS